MTAEKREGSSNGDIKERLHALETARAVQAATVAGMEATQTAAMSGAEAAQTAMPVGNMTTTTR